jgi:hypothetical protein
MALTFPCRWCLHQVFVLFPQPSDSLNTTLRVYSVVRTDFSETSSPPTARNSSLNEPACGPFAALEARLKARYWSSVALAIFTLPVPSASFARKLGSRPAACFHSASSLRKSAPPRGGHHSTTLRHTVCPMAWHSVDAIETKGDTAWKPAPMTGSRPKIFSSRDCAISAPLTIACTHW